MNSKIYSVDKEYLKYLRLRDINTPSPLWKVYGITTEIENNTYFIPLSMPNIKHKFMHNQRDFMKIKEGRLGAINFNNMIPVPKDMLVDIDIKKISSEREKNILNAQYRFCKSNYAKIHQKAEKLRDIIINEKSFKLASRCCNFEYLEEECKYFDYEKLTNKRKSLLEYATGTEKIIEKDNIER